VERLGALGRKHADRVQRRDKASRVEDSLGERQDVLVDGNPLPERAVREEIVRVERVGALEGVRRRPNVELALDAGDVRQQSLDERRLDRVPDDRVAVALDAREVGQPVGVGEHRRSLIADNPTRPHGHTARAFSPPRRAR